MTMFLVGLLIGVILGWVLAMIAYGAFIPLWEALYPKKRNGGACG